MRCFIIDARGEPSSDPIEAYLLETKPFPSMYILQGYSLASSA